MAGDLHSRSVSSSGGRLLSLGSVTAAKICNFAIFCRWLSFNVVQFQTSCDSLSVGLRDSRCKHLRKSPLKIEEIAESF